MRNIMAHEYFGISLAFFGSAPRRCFARSLQEKEIFMNHKPAGLQAIKAVQSFLKYKQLEADPQPQSSIT